MSRSDRSNSMMKTSFTWAVAVGLIIFAAGCGEPAGPPPDIMKTQRESLNKAKALEGKMQQQAEERGQAAEDQQK